MGSLDKPFEGDAERNRHAKIQFKNFSHTTTYPFDVWTPAPGRIITLTNVFMACNNKHTNPMKLTLEVQMPNDDWKDLCCLYLNADETDHMSHGVVGNVRVKAIRVDKSGGSSNFTACATVLGTVLD